jgi:demethylmenaquinone methyltransferase / 2-methoxy-6-polyprenyl-1,4-benzoquinol methylase
VNESLYVHGTTPPGTTDEKQAASWVRDMFGRVAPRYDLLNHLLSFNIDRGWRKRLLERVRPVLQRRQPAVLDLCCGTGDVLLDLQEETPTPVIGADFCHPMLIEARRKIASRKFRSQVLEGDALHLPLRSSSFDLITISFGFRNLTSYGGGLQELQRVLKPGGLLAVLEFSHPPNAIVRVSYQFYSSQLLPVIGRALSGSATAYKYLPDSIAKFPDAPALASMMRSAGFTNVEWKYLTCGIAALHTGYKTG